MVANGDHISSTGYYKEVTLTLQDVSITTDFFLIALEGCDIVLGAQWLRTLGPILWDFSQLSMKFSLNGSDYILKGETIDKPSILNPSKLRKALLGKGVLLQLCGLQGEILNAPTDPQSSLTNMWMSLRNPQGYPHHDHRTIGSL